MSDMKVNKYFPGFTPKAITFSIDDGSLNYDKIFIDIVRPAGIKGTFNLFFGRGKRAISDEEYREFYRGFEISNHCNRHPFAFNSEKEYHFTDEVFNKETADTNLVYKSDREGVYLIYHRSYWATLATNEAYLELAEEGRRDIEEIFGKGSVRGFVWPYGRQKNEELFEELKKAGYASIRRAYSDSFSVPEDKMDWGVNADSTNFETKILEFDDLSDDGELKYFCFGLHSVDFERSNKWNELREFASKYGNRPSDFWYSGVEDIFEYDRAMRSLEITEEKIYNPSDKELYISVNDKKYVLKPKSEAVI